MGVLEQFMFLFRRQGSNKAMFGSRDKHHVKAFLFGLPEKDEAAGRADGKYIRWQSRTPASITPPTASPPP